MSPSIPVMSANDKTTKALLVGGALAGPLFTTAWIIESALTAHYDPLRHLISQLALGEFGGMQIANFLISGFLILGFAFGLRRALGSSGSVWGPLLIGLGGIGLIGAGIFATDPGGGYPPNTPFMPTELSTHGILHNLFAAPFLFGLPIACFVFARVFARLGERGWAIYSVVSGATTFVVFLLARLGLLGTLFGLQQRISITVSLLWLTLVAIYLLTARPGESNRALDG